MMWTPFGGDAHSEPEVADIVWTLGRPRGGRVRGIRAFRQLRHNRAEKRTCAVRLNGHVGLTGVGRIEEASWPNDLDDCVALSPPRLIGAVPTAVVARLLRAAHRVAKPRAGN
jgi:hypothetical protein